MSLIRKLNKDHNTIRCMKYNILIFRHFYSFGILDIPYDKLDGQMDRTTTDWEEVEE